MPKIEKTPADAEEKVRPWLRIFALPGPFETGQRQEHGEEGDERQQHRFRHHRQVQRPIIQVTGAATGIQIRKEQRPRPVRRCARRHKAIQAPRRLKTPRQRLIRRPVHPLNATPAARQLKRVRRPIPKARRRRPKCPRPRLVQQQNHRPVRRHQIRIQIPIVTPR